MNISEKVIRIIYTENAMNLVKDCRSGDPSRLLYCILSHVIGSLSAIMLPILIVVGVVGNSIVAYIMLARQRPLTRQNLYLGFNAMSDILSLIVNGLFNGFLNKGLPWLTRGQLAFISYNLSDFMCKASRYMMNFCQTLSCLWLLVLVTDRTLAVHWPLRMKKAGIRWAGRALAGTFALAAAIALPNGLLMGHQYINLPDGTVLVYCYRVPKLRLFMLTFTTALSTPPFVFILVMLALDIFLAHRVVSAIRKRRNLTESGGEQNSLKGMSGTIVVLLLAVSYFVLHVPLMVTRPIVEVALYQLDLISNVDYITLMANLAYVSLSVALINQCVSFFVLYNRSQSFRQRLMGRSVYGSETS